MSAVKNIHSLNLQQTNNNPTTKLHETHTRSKMQIYEELESAIYKWQFSVRERTGNRNFRAVPHLADACEVTEGTFYKWLEGDLNGTKLGLSNFAKIVIETEDIDLLNAFIDEIKSKIQIKHAVK